MTASFNANVVLERSMQQLVKFVFLSFLLALALTHTSKLLWLNIPLALLVVFGLHWLSSLVDIRAKQNSSHSFKRRFNRFSEDSSPGSPHHNPPVPPAPSSKSGDKWREQVGSPLVEHAWETLCGSIVQEFVYDAWYSSLTPDREFPREIRRILNTAFGELADRARQTDVRKMLLGDISALLMDQILLYRDTRESILAGVDEKAWRHMLPAAREKALQAEMKAESNLHPALYPPSEDGSAILGHYKVVRHIAEGMVAFLLERHDHAKPIMRSVARELLSSCVLRSIMTFFCPYTVNKIILSLLKEKVSKQPLGAEDLAAAATVAVGAEVAPKPSEDFEKRVRQSAALEDHVVSSSKPVLQGGHGHEHTGKSSVDIPTDFPSATSEPAPSSRAASRPPSRGPSPTRKERKERKQWSPGKPDKFRAPPNPFPSHKKTAGADPLAAALAERMESSNGASASGHDRSGSEASDDWEEVTEARRTKGKGEKPMSGLKHVRSATTDLSGSNHHFNFMQDGQQDSAEDRSQRSQSSDGGPPERYGGADLHSSSGMGGAGFRARGDDGPQRYCFMGRPHARIVTAELKAESNRDVVIYKIRVGDDTGEWTVSRRFRNFETLHRALRDLPSYHLRLPAKRIFSQQQSVEFVEERRQQLNGFLQSLLAIPPVATCREVWEFLSAWSELYGITADAGFLRAVGAKIQGANNSVRRAMGDIVEEMDTHRRKSFALLARKGADGRCELDEGELPPVPRASRSFSKDLSKLRSFRSGSKRQNVVSHPTYPGTEKAQANGGAKVVRIAGPADNLSCAGTAHVQGARDILQGQQAPYGISLTADLGSDSAASTPSDSIPGASLVQAQASHSSKASALHSTAGATPNETPPSATPASSRGVSPSQLSMADPLGAGVFQPPQQAQRASDSSSSAEAADQAAAADGFRQCGSRSSALRDVRHLSEVLPEQRRMHVGSGMTPGLVRSNSWDEPGALPEPAQPPLRAAMSLTAPGSPPKKRSQRAPSHRADSGHISFGGIVQSPSVATVAANIEAVGAPLTLKAPDLLPREDADMADWEEAAGISAPLYEIVDTVFELQSRGFFRRQVFGAARQMLSLVAGGAIDEWLLSNLRTLRQEHALARVLAHLQAQLWPGGTWFQSLPEYQRNVSANKQQERWVMTIERFLMPDPNPPIDEEEIREAVWELLFSRAPPALVRVVGKQVYHSGMTDLFEMLQSRTFVQQFGYGLLKVLLVNLFPELKLLFKKIERGALEQNSSGSKAAPKAGGGQAGNGGKAASKAASKAAASAANPVAEPSILNPPVPPNGMKRGARKIAPGI